MKSLRLINYRCFEDTKEVALKPITLLLGANSTGKSSFLKFFPLLKQSSATNVRGFFLWSGNLVDFRDFKNTVREGKGDMTFKIKIESLKWISSAGRTNSSTTKDVNVSITLAKTPKTPYDYTKKVIISFKSDVNFPINKVCLNFTPTNLESISINGNEIDKGKTILMNSERLFLPNIYFITETPNQGINWSIDISKDIARICKCTAEQVMFITREAPRLIGAKNFMKELQLVTNSKINITLQEQQKIECLLIYSCLNDLLTSIHFFLANVADNTHYILPQRVVTERYYNFRNSSVDYIEADGKNMPMFLSSLSDEQKIKLNEWLKKHFSIELAIVNRTGRIEVDIIEYKPRKNTRSDISSSYSYTDEKKKSPKRNLVDVGFGYTQILPIILTIWNILVRDDKQTTTLSQIFQFKERIIVIEQPELHLHPRFQKAFADVLVKIVSDEDIYRRYNIKFIIETHSEYILNEIGFHIGHRTINKNDATIVYFNDTSLDPNRSKVEVVSYDDEGYVDKTACGFNSESDAY